ncbi:MAG: single-stranded-DNA-specific exonuclease RecJ [Rudaea sp.]
MKPVRIRRREAPQHVADALPAALHPVLRRILAARGIACAEDLEHRLAWLLPPTALGGVERAGELLEEALLRTAPIIIVGDFDADGATGTAVAVRGLRLLGARDVDYGVPNRFVHGYGLGPLLVEELVARHPGLVGRGLLITVDNGVAAHAGVAAAKAHGLGVIVTDHHLPGQTLPAADAMINPNLEADAFPSKALAGVGVMFYLLLALRARLRERGWFGERGIAEPDLSCLLDLVALGTVADLVPLDRNNRILVEAGLKRIRAGRACAGIVALLECAKRDPARAVASDLGFAVAPRINAAGRLEDIRLGIECLISDDAQRARSLAQALSAINSERRELQSDMVERAEAVVHSWVAARGVENLPVGVVLFDPEWHHGVVGLVASKLKEILNRPVIACAPAAEGSDEIKASGRSIAGFHLRDALAEVEARAPGLLLRFGGHAMAAGMTLLRCDLERFVVAFDEVARARICEADLDAVLLTDGELSSSELSLELAQQLRFAGPWGQAFPEPLFDGLFDIESTRTMGESHRRLNLRCAQSTRSVEAVQFNVDLAQVLPRTIRAVYQLEVNDWNDRQQLRLLLRHVEPA